MPLKIRNKLLVAFLSLIMVILTVAGIVGYYNQQSSDEAVRRVQTISEEVIATANLGHALEHAIMPANDYLITGSRRYVDEFKKFSAEMEERLSETKKLLDRLHALNIQKVEDERSWLKEIEVAWQNIKEISLKIFEIPDPIGNRDGAKLMEEMDYKWARHATDLINKWHEVDTEEYGEAVGAAERAKSLSWSIMAASGVLLLVLGAWFAVFYSRLFVRPIEDIHHGADAIAAGNFKTRLDIKTGDEIEQLSNAMNEMAGKLDDFYGTLENQVEEKTRECRESENKYRSMIESANDMIWMLDSEGMFLFINNQAEKSSGYTVEEVMGKHYLTVIHPEDRAMREEYFKKTLSGERTQFTVKALGKDGGERILILQVSSAPVYKEGKVVGTVNFGRDITELKKTEEALKESEERFRIIAETAADAIICMRSPGAVTLWNKSAERMFGYAADDVIGKNLHDIIVPERYKEKSREGLKGFFETGTGPVVGKAIEIFALRRDGSEFPVELSISAMRIKDEWQTAAIVRDITERKEAEEKLKKNLDDIKRMNKMMVDREIKMIELKKENQKLINEIQDLKFPILNS